VRTVDAVVVGSGHNGLIAAAYLARAGWDVEVLERNPTAGGAIATEELTEPGFLHDTFSGWHTLFHLSQAWAELGAELGERGLEYVHTDDLVTGTVSGERPPVLLHRDRERTVEQFGPDAAPYLSALDAAGAHGDIVGQLLGVDLASWRSSRPALRLAARLRRRDGLAFAADVLSSARAWLDRFSGHGVPDLLAPWVLHTGLSPEDAGGGFQLPAIAGALHDVGEPVVRGGSAGLVRALVQLIEDNGGRVRTGVDVDQILVSNDRARAVVAGDEELRVHRAVIANVTPSQLYGRLLPAGAAPALATAQAGRFRFSRRGGMQIHLALSEPPRWRAGAELARVPIVHVTGGLPAVTLACGQASAGLLPAEPTIVCGQPTAVDPSRAPEGKAIIWIQLQEVPYAPTGDAAGELDVGDGSWGAELEQAFADRVIARLAREIENLPEAIVGRALLSPRELERRNPNLGRGDIYAGATDLSQSFLWRPLPSYGSHATPVRGLYQCGASTYPGPGLNGASGRIVAMKLLGRRQRAR
jgi:phytoene dehydrogenase-like protein